MVTKASITSYCWTTLDYPLFDTPFQFVKPIFQVSFFQSNLLLVLELGDEQF